jgi:thymidylate kinase
MYIALEGIKGTGKSTILNGLLNDDISKSLELFEMTKAPSFYSPLEELLKRKVDLKQNDAYMEQLFLKRALMHTKNLKYNRPIVLGDRSIATSYVTRWQKWGDPCYTLRRVNEQYKYVPMPDVIIWLKNPVASSLRNIAARPVKQLGKNDEAASALEMASNVYDELFDQKLFQRKVKKTQIITVPNSGTIEELLIEIKSIINHYKK